MSHENIKCKQCEKNEIYLNNLCRDCFNLNQKVYRNLKKMEYQPEENCISINDPSLMNKSLESISNNLSIKIDLLSVLNTLPAREQKVIKLRYGLYDGYSRTLEETGQIFGITRERIRQIEAKALRRLRHPTRARKLMGYLD